MNNNLLKIINIRNFLYSDRLTKKSKFKEKQSQIKPELDSQELTTEDSNSDDDNSHEEQLVDINDIQQKEHIKNLREYKKLENKIKLLLKSSTPLQTKPIEKVVITPQQPVLKNKINVFMIIHNIGSYYRYFEYMANDIEKYIDVNWFIYENNSENNTVNFLKRFMQNRKGKLINEKLYRIFDTEDICCYRAWRIAEARNKNIQMLDNDVFYNFIIDTNVFFSYKQTLKPLINFMEKKTDCVAVCSNGIDILTGDYYDTLALNYGQHGGGGIKFQYPYTGVHTCFGGVMLVKNNMLKKCKYNTRKVDTCEHWSFCKQLKQYSGGNIYILRNSVCHWIKDMNGNMLRSGVFDGIVKSLIS